MHRVLISAYACEPGRGSEGEIGWSLVHELAKFNQVWVITRANNRAVHEATFAYAGKPEQLHFIYYDTPKWARWYKKGKRFFLVYYYCWQIGSFLEARKFIQREPIDFVHHLTGGMDWMPSGLAMLNLPFIWGPVGSEETHPEILRTLPFRVQLKELFRKLIRCCCREMDPLVRLTGKKAQMILSHTPENLPKRYQSKIRPYVQTGVLPTPRFACMKTSFKRGELFTVLYAGELVHWKGAAYALDAFLHFAQGKAEVRMVVMGEGPLRPQLQTKVVKAGMEAQVIFLGKVTMDVLIERMSSGDVFLYPCYHHGLATVVLQAMLTGLPVVCLEGDAIGRVVGSEGGITVPLLKGADFVRGLSDALSRLYSDETLRMNLAKQAQKMVLDRFSYPVIGAGYEKIYQSIRQERI